MIIKLKKYVTSECDILRSHVNWTLFKENVDKLNLNECANELLTHFKQRTPSEDCVKTFHISTNMTGNCHTEPSHENTTKMIYKFLMFIYQRNIIASLVKYILLQDILQKLDSSQLTKTYKGVFSSMKTRLNEIVFECVLTAFNGSNYDNLSLIHI